MLIYRFLFFILLNASLILSGCSKGFSNEKDLYSWMNNKKNGLVKVKEINGIKLTVKYLPSQYLAYKELKNTGAKHQNIDSLNKWYENTHSFILNIGLIEEAAADVDIMKLGVSNYEEYREKFMTMNFDMGQYISLKINNKEFSPVLANLENVYGLAGDRNINLVFPKDDLPAEEIDLIFNDEIFNTGITHFTFKPKDAESLPPLKFLKK